MITKDDVHEIARQVVRECREEVNHEIKAVKSEVAWTEERAQKVATMAAEIAVKQITDNFYLSVGRKTIATIGAMVVVGLIAFKDNLKTIAGMK